jgi:phosphate transport system substrate-binding protein
MKKTAIAVAGLVLSAGLLAGCGSNGNVSKASGDSKQSATSTSSVSGSISMSGSSALYPLAQKAATQFQSENPNVVVTVGAGGSGTGLNNVLAGTVEIGNSDIYADEKLEKADAEQLTDHKVSLIGVAIIVNADIAEKIKDLSSDQLKQIFSGKATSWDAVGGPSEPITIVNRPSSSGTRALFEKWALGGAASNEGSSSLQTDDSNALLASVGQTKGAIGYVALSYLVAPNPNVGQVSIDGVEATYDNIYSNKYQVWGYEHMYTKGEPNETTKAFLDYMTSKKIMSLGGTMGYGDVSKLNDAAAKSR